VKPRSSVVALSTLLVSGLAAGDRPRSSIAPALQAKADAIHAIGVPGVLAEAVIEQERVAVRSGVADLETRVPMPYDAHFHIASNSKTFTATVVLQLVGEGKLSLDDTVEKWLPGLVKGNGNDGSRIAIRNLLQHTSGLVDYTGDLPIHSAEDWERERFRTYKPEELVAMSMTHSPSWLPERGETRFSYSNVNFVIAGMVIEKATGHTWEREVRRRIVQPLGLNGTVVPETSPDLPEPHARSYVQFAPDGPFVDTTRFNATIVGASGAIISTTSDMNTFLRALVTGKLLKPAQLAQMQTTVEAKDLYPGALYGLGLFWRPLSCGGGYWSHMGDGAAGATRNGVTPDGRRSAVVFMSSQLIMPKPHEQQEKLAAQLVEHALCAK
jgi:D-alanyl-D-alanine carboxypeptidase